MSLPACVSSLLHKLPSKCGSEFRVWTRFAGLSAAKATPLWHPGKGLLPQAPPFNHCRPVTVAPICMGRRAAKIATRKNAQDARKSKIYGRIGKQIVSAVREGGPSPDGNPKLNLALKQAALYGVPKDIIERNIKKASDKSQADYVEVTYEAYGLGGVGVVVECLTDNLNRAAANVRDVVKKAGWKMAEPGSVMFNFKRVGLVAVNMEATDGDELMMAALDSGADDVLEDEDEERFKVITSMEKFLEVRAALEAGSFPVDTESSGLQLLATSEVEVGDEQHMANEAGLERLLELDDVDSVYCNQS